MLGYGVYENGKKALVLDLLADDFMTIITRYKIRPTYDGICRCGKQIVGTIRQWTESHINLPFLFT